ncbi:hypothetical protein I7I51_03951 [Histoplasma capsulatum]|uniref:Ankyrin repeat protein n=1 Tax=Ajellomyces capsulatus TaxID=5037 RepID=A0A8A1MAY4_AJECA|nr:predicted protein [Histoplasma mississippiense (nom. inval.)]EDN08102.1 predicted protein [Histoplasma mississippiense (nom. inval.)]QSS61774.1 hypothetical protein I7I51_03951 [Histoplasma capsulatum]
MNASEQHTRDGHPRRLSDTYVIRKFASADDDDYDDTCYICFEGWKAGDEMKVKEQLDKNINCSAQNFLGRTALHSAALRNHKAVAEILLDCGADASIVDYKKQAPLHIASSSFSLGIAILLVERGADISARDGGGMTPLHLAYQCGTLDTIRYLLEKGADPNAKDVYGFTPEMLRPDVVEYLTNAPIIQAFERAIDDIKATEA